MLPATSRTAKHQFQPKVQFLINLIKATKHGSSDLAEACLAIDAIPSLYSGL
jgi:hypothetical protein